MKSPARRRVLAGCAVAALTLTPAVSTTAAAAPTDGPKNVILLISDGGGFNQFDSTNFYRQGTGAYQVTTDADGNVVPDPANTTGAEVYMQDDWTQLAMSHYSQTTIDGGFTYVDTNAWGDFDWVNNKPTDSAAAGTAMSTGFKTTNGILGYTPDGQKLTTAGEVAQDSGRKLGLVTSVPFNHATPASFIAHNQDRNDYTGLASEMLYSGADVIMGAGHPKWTDDHTERTADYTWIDAGDYSSLIGGKTPFTYVQDKADFESLAQCTATAEDPGYAEEDTVFGLAEVAETLQERRAGGTDADVELGVTPMNDVPSLETMTQGALNVLSQDSKGFFLMVEGGAVDWAGHSNFTNHLIEEQTDFNRSVDAVNQWVEENSSWDETLVIVTADHETGYLAGVDANPDWTPMAGEAGKLPEVTWHSGNHTNALVPLFAKGAGADQLVAAADETDSVRGAYLDNTELGSVMQTLMKDAPVTGTGAINDPCVVPAAQPTTEPTDVASEQPTTEPTTEPTTGPTDDASGEATSDPTAAEGDEQPTEAAAAAAGAGSTGSGASTGAGAVTASETGSGSGAKGAAVRATSQNNGQASHRTGSLAHTGSDAALVAASAGALALAGTLLARRRRA